MCGQNTLKKNSISYNTFKFLQPENYDRKISISEIKFE